ncbi:MAG: hypothetical protein LBQ38_06485 [Spirochaetaceae bacterium]|jgi:hypothetical protein|nr:hypothetical protein [Spirochaetaceae bacterium]
MNSIVTVLRVFKNSTLITPRGEYKISRVFPTVKAAIKAGYVRHCTGNGVDIYTNKDGTAARFAVIGE